MTELDGWHGALQHLKIAYKDESIVSNIATANFADDDNEYDDKMKLINIDENMSHRSCIPMDSDKYEIGRFDHDLGFDGGMPGIIDVSSIHDDDDSGRLLEPQQDGFKLDMSALTTKPTQDIQVDLADDIIHATEDLSCCSGSLSTDGSSIILNLWNEDFDGKPDPKIMQKLIQAKHLPRGLDPVVITQVKRAKIINQLKELEAEDSSQGSCDMLFNYCGPRICASVDDDLTDEESMNNSIVDSVKEASVDASLDIEDFHHKRPQKSKYALIPDSKFQPGMAAQELVLVLPKNADEIAEAELGPSNSFLPIQQAVYDADDDGSEDCKTCKEEGKEFTLQKYDRAPHRIAELVLAGKKSEAVDYSEMTNQTIESTPPRASPSFDSVVLDTCVLGTRRIAEDGDPIDGDRSVIDSSNEIIEEETASKQDSNQEETPLTGFVKLFSDPEYQYEFQPPPVLEKKLTDEEADADLNKPEILVDVPDADGRNEASFEEGCNDINLSIEPESLGVDQSNRVDGKEDSEVNLSRSGVEIACINDSNLSIGPNSEDENSEENLISLDDKIGSFNDPNFSIDPKSDDENSVENLVASGNKIATCDDPHFSNGPETDDGKPVENLVAPGNKIASCDDPHFSIGPETDDGKPAENLVAPGNKIVSCDDPHFSIVPETDDEKPVEKLVLSCDNIASSDDPNFSIQPESEEKDSGYIGISFGDKIACISDTPNFSIDPKSIQLGQFSTTEDEDSEEQLISVADTIACINKATVLASESSEPLDLGQIEELATVNDDYSEATDDEANEGNLEARPILTASSLTDGDECSLNPVGSSYSFCDKENPTPSLNIANEIKDSGSQTKLEDSKLNEKESKDPLEGESATKQTEQIFVEDRQAFPSNAPRFDPSAEKSADTVSNDSKSSSLLQISACCDGSTLRRTNTNDGIEELMEALDITLEVKNTSSCSTMDGEEVVVASPVEGVIVDQPKSIYGRIIPPEEFEMLQEGFFNALEQQSSCSEDVDEDTASLTVNVGEAGGKDRQSESEAPFVEFDNVDATKAPSTTSEPSGGSCEMGETTEMNVGKKVEVDLEVMFKAAPNMKAEIFKNVAIMQSDASVPGVQRIEASKVMSENPISFVTSEQVMSSMTPLSTSSGVFFDAIETAVDTKMTQDASSIVANVAKDDEIILEIIDDLNTNATSELEQEANNSASSLSEASALEPSPDAPKRKGNKGKKRNKKRSKGKKENGKGDRKISIAGELNALRKEMAKKSVNSNKKVKPGPKTSSLSTKSLLDSVVKDKKNTNSTKVSRSKDISERTAFKLY